MKSKNRRSIVPVLIVVAFIAFITGVIVSSSFKITPTIKALEGKDVKRTETDPVGDSQLFVKLAAKLKPVAVNISTTKVIKKRRRSFVHPYGRGGMTLLETFSVMIFSKGFSEEIVPKGIISSGVLAPDSS